MILEFSGWIECDPAKTTFQYIGGEALKNEFKLLGQDFNSHIITGAEYMALHEDEKDCYMLEDLGQAYINSLDGELSELTLDIEANDNYGVV